MPAKHFVEIGRVVMINHGPDAGKTAAIVDVIDQNRALVDGPATGLRRQAIAFTRLRLTRFRLSIPHGTSTKVVAKAWAKDDVSTKFSQTKVAQRLANNARKEQLTDFERFKLYKTKQRVNKLVQLKFEKLKAKAKRDKPKIKTTPRQNVAKKNKAKRQKRKASKAAQQVKK